MKARLDRLEKRSRPEVEAAPVRFIIRTGDDDVDDLLDKHKDDAGRPLPSFTIRIDRANGDVDGDGDPADA